MDAKCGTGAELSAEISELVSKAVTAKASCSGADVVIDSYRFNQLCGGSNYSVQCTVNGGKKYVVRLSRPEGLAPQFASRMVYSVTDVAQV